MILGEHGATRYTAARGIIELRKAICATSKARRGVEHTPSEVVVSVGAKHTLFNLALALYEPGDEVIVPTPYWVSYPEHAKLGGATPVIVETTAAEGFRLTPEKLRAVVTPKTKALVLCSPSNPTGAAYTGEQLRALAHAPGVSSIAIHHTRSPPWIVGIATNAAAWPSWRASPRLTSQRRPQPQVHATSPRSVSTKARSIGAIIAAHPAGGAR